MICIILCLRMCLVGMPFCNSPVLMLLPLLANCHTTQRPAKVYDPFRMRNLYGLIPEYCDWVFFGFMWDFIFISGKSIRNNPRDVWWHRVWDDCLPERTRLEYTKRTKVILLRLNVWSFDRGAVSFYQNFSHIFFLFICKNQFIFCNL